MSIRPLSRPLRAALLLQISVLSACSSEPSSSSVGVGAAGNSGGGAAGAFQQVSGGAGAGGMAGAAGTAPVGGAAGSGNGGAGAGAAGASGASGASGVAGQDGFTDPGTDGDGDFMLQGPYKPSPLNLPGATATPGKQITYKMLSSESTIYPGLNGAYSRSVWLYVPSQYVPGSKAPFLVVQDGYFALWFGNDLPHNPNPTGPNLPGTANVPLIVENLSAAGKLPPLVVLFVDNGGGDGGGSERGLEYDTVSGKYAEFIQTEVLPRAVKEAKSQLMLDLAFTDDPRGRGTLGGSSGGAASFSAAWFHPDYFTRVVSFSGTFVRQASPEDPMYPHGGWAYHDFDPYQDAAPNGVIMKEPTPKPIRVWLEVGQNDLGAGSGPDTYRDFRLANQRMAASFKAKQYHYHFDLAAGAGHVDGNVVAQTLPDALAWAWRGYPVK